MKNSFPNNNNAFRQSAARPQRMAIKGDAALEPVLTGNAQCHRRVDAEPFWQDILAAGKAISIFILIKTAQRRVQYRQPVPPPFLSRHIHRLLLHRVHSRQAAERLLVKLDRRSALTAAVTQGAQLVNLLQDLFATNCVVHTGVA
jgi:hypothetical protein